MGLNLLIDIKKIPPFNPASGIYVCVCVCVCVCALLFLCEKWI